jgi:hypothetical protein
MVDEDSVASGNMLFLPPAFTDDLSDLGEYTGRSPRTVVEGHCMPYQMGPVAPMPPLTFIYRRLGDTQAARDTSVRRGLLDILQMRLRCARRPDLHCLHKDFQRTGKLLE